MAKKYLSKIVKENSDIFLKDAEARASVQDLQAVSALTANQVESIWDEVFNSNNNNNS